MNSPTIHETAAHLADLCASKNAAYGNSVGKSAEVLALLYPRGLRPDQYADALFAARQFDKHARIAQGADDPHGEDPRLDIAGYSLLALHKAKEAHTWQGSANDAAQTPSKATPDSAASDASATTITSGSASNESPTSPKPNAPSESTLAPVWTSISSAPAPAATVHASSVEAVLQKAVANNDRGLCAGCGLPRSFTVTSQAIPETIFRFCSYDCADHFHDVIVGARRFV